MFRLRPSGMVTGCPLSWTFDRRTVPQEVAPMFIQVLQGRCTTRPRWAVSSIAGCEQTGPGRMMI